MRAALRVIRHAPVSVDGVCYGRAEVPVSLEARDALARLVVPRADLVWSSPSIRCRELAALISVELGASFRQDERLREMNFGDWEGVPWDDIEEKTLCAWTQQWETAAPPGGETIGALECRVGAWEADLNVAQEHLLIAHAGVVRALWVLRESISWPTAMRRDVPWLTVLEIGRE